MSVESAHQQPINVVNFQNGDTGQTLESERLEDMTDEVQSPNLGSAGGSTSGESHDEQTEYLHQSPAMGMYPSAGMMMMVQSEGAPSNSHTPPQSSSPPRGPELHSLLKVQLEYYFSKDNLVNDKYLLSQMDGDHFVPISILAGFNQVKRLTGDMNALVEAIKESTCLQLDPTFTKVRAVPEKRCILILREIPKETPQEDIQSLFSSSCPKFLSCEFAENDCWYVTFISEEEAQEAHRYLREEVREFLGKPIRARIKNTAVQRTTSLPKQRTQYPYQNMYNGQPVPFYPTSAAAMAWPPYYMNAPFNGMPNHPYGGGPQGSNRFPPGGNPSGPRDGGNAGQGVGGGGATREAMRRGNMGKTHQRHSSDGGLNSSTVTTSTTSTVERRTNSTSGTGSGGGGSSGHYSGPSGGRYRSRDHDERTRNLPNRLKKRYMYEEASGDRSGDRGERGERGERGDRRTRYRNQQKLDLAPTNFPPLPGGGGDAAVAPPPPPPPPDVLEESNPKLADIVKGRHGNGTATEKPLPSVSTPMQKPPIQSPVSTMCSTKPTTSPIATTMVTSPVTPTCGVTTTIATSPTAASTPGNVATTATVSSTGATSSSGVSSSGTSGDNSTAGPVQYSKPMASDTKVASSKDRPTVGQPAGKTPVRYPTDKENKYSTPRTQQATRNPSSSSSSSSNSTNGNSNTKTTKYRENSGRDKDRRSTSLSSAPSSTAPSTSRSQRQSPKPIKKAPPPPPAESTSSGSEKPTTPTEEAIKPEKLSYAQMAQQKPKASPQKSNNGTTQKPLSSPPHVPPTSATTSNSSSAGTSPPPPSPPPPLANDSTNGGGVCATTVTGVGGTAVSSEVPLSSPSSSNTQSEST